MMTESVRRPSAGVLRMSLLRLLFVFGLLAGVSARTVPEDGPRKPFSLEDILYSKFQGMSIGWLTENSLQFREVDGGNILSCSGKHVSLLVDASVLKRYNATWYKFSHDSEYLLMRYNETGRYRHSTTASYVVYSLRNKTFTDVAERAFLQVAEWVPMSDKIVYIKENNIYFSRLGDGRSSYPVTQSGIPGQVFNGIADWVYEEDVLRDGAAFSISPNGKHMVYLTIDDRNVHSARFMEYGEPGTLKDQYDSEVVIPYPKPGTPIPRYQLRFFNFTDKSTGILESDLLQTERDIVFGWDWVTNNTVAVVYANRVQNVSITDICRLGYACKKLYEDRNPKGWANFDVPRVSDSGRYLVRARQMVGGNEYYHIHLVRNGSRIALTNGTFMVREITDWDRESGFVYYRASDPKRPSSDHIYVVSETGKGEPFCLTCQMKTPEGVPCQSGTVDFNSNFRSFIGTCNGPTPSVISVYNWTAPSTMSTVIALFLSQATRDFLKERVEPVTINTKVKVTDSIEAEARLLLSPDMDTSGKKKYPLIIYVYGGPAADQITDKFKLDWSLYLTTNRSIVYGIIDGRGSGRKSTEMMYALYRALGTVEIQDQITVTKYLRDKFPFIDPARIGIWGWSYGGYATTKVLENDSEGIFRCGVAVAPVSDWIYYNSVYTERYMDLPASNPKGYRTSSTLYNVSNLKKKEYLLIHGTGDDNVHYQHAMQLAKVLERNNVLFEQEAYPDEAHSISRLRPHLYFTMDRFWKRCFGESP